MSPNLVIFRLCQVDEDVWQRSGCQRGNWQESGKVGISRVLGGKLERWVRWNEMNGEEVNDLMLALLDGMSLLTK